MLNKDLTKKLSKNHEVLEDCKRKKIHELTEFVRLKKDQEQIKDREELDKIEKDQYNILNNEAT